MRPEIHFTPPSGWMNDPNGLVYLDGEYHLFYQHNPFDINWGHTSWGHAVSRDLLHWQHLPVAIPETDGVMAFSGSAVVDWHNTSRLGNGRNPPLVAAFTGFHPDTKIQDQRIAYSQDNGRTWHLYANNPIINLNETEFRDPKLLWHDNTQKWVMVVGLAMQRKLQFYKSTNLREWQFMSDLALPTAGTGVWECPDLFPMKTAAGREKWVLVISIGSGAIGGGSGVQYFVGEFDGCSFTADAFPPKWLDFGPDFYAVASWNNLPTEDGRTICLGWMSNLQYANVTPATAWRGQQSLPRELQLVEGENGYSLRQRPVYELQSQRRPYCQLSSFTIPNSSAFTQSLPMAAEIQLAIQPQTTTDIQLQLKAGHSQTLAYWIHISQETITLDRARIGHQFHAGFPNQFIAPLKLENGRVTLNIWLDLDSVELFTGNGRIAFSSLFFREQKPCQLIITPHNSHTTIIDCQIWSLQTKNLSEQP
ncbi:glycoside hydrolase family 32 protein [Candidatus Leptofilum sp.]|uniref:glycoside hydrolase family 32 protein n=1 Tax=Candidatus Leptofilum sp. TaxID=3241576 RepID=UPI003B596639